MSMYLEMEKHIKKPFKLKVFVDPYIEIVIRSHDPVYCVTLAHRCIDLLREAGFDPDLELCEIEGLEIDET